MSRFEVFGVPGLPEVRPGDDLPALVGAALHAAGSALVDGDVLVLAQKIVSKAEGRYVDLNAIAPSPRAEALARETDKDARLVEVILSESDEVVRCRPGLIIVRHRLGLVMANAGVDHSNLAPAPGVDAVLLLPEDPDASAAAMRAAMKAATGVDVAVVVTDSVGRPWRTGTTGLAIGASGVPAVIDLRGLPDRNGRTLEVSQVGFADQIAGAAALAMGEGSEGIPVVVIRGLALGAPELPARAVVRPPEQDLFR